MATMTTEHDQHVDRGHATAVQLDAELAVVASLVRAADERTLLGHTHGVRRDHECPTCQLLAWAATA